MSHPEQRAFFSAVAAANKAIITDSSVLEIGSYDVNGGIRNMFADCSQYVGVDLMQGPGVDRVAYGHEFDDPDNSYDITLSGECFEHNPYWRETLSNMVRMTRPGGLVAFTCASRCRLEHGTTRTKASDSPGTQAEGLDYYRNLTEDDFKVLPLGNWFTQWKFWYMPTSFDLYFAGIRTGQTTGPVGALPNDTEVKAIRQMSSVLQRTITLPLKVLRTVVADEEAYQKSALLYWRTIHTMGRRYLALTQIFQGS